jgi:hypothetical protein
MGNLNSPLFTESSQGVVAVISGGLETFSYRLAKVYEAGDPAVRVLATIQTANQRAPSFSSPAIPGITLNANLSTEGGRLGGPIYDAAMPQIASLMQVETFAVLAREPASPRVAVEFDCQAPLLPTEDNAPDIEDVVMGVLQVAAVTGGKVLLRSVEKNLLLGDLARQVYALWSIEVADLSQIAIGRKRIADWTNAALQQIYSRSDRLDYFNRRTLSVTVGTGGETPLVASIQRLQGPVRIASGRRPLRALHSRAEYESFALCYDAGAEPAAFFLDSQVGTTVDSAELKLCIAPPPSTDTEFLIDVTLEPPRFDEVDLIRGVLIPIPHKWAETLLLPMVKKWALSDSLCTKRAELEREITQQYLRAQEILGLADPSPAESIRPKPREASQAAA